MKKYTVSLSGVFHVLELIVDGGVNVYELFEAAEAAEDQFGRGWVSVQNGEVAITRGEWIAEIEEDGEYEIVNEECAKKFAALLAGPYVDFGNESDQLTNLLADAMHWARENNVSFGLAYSDAQEHFHDEIGVGGE